MNTFPIDLARLWPNRTHESNWVKGALCAVGAHRWYRVDVPVHGLILPCRFCRWCPKVEPQKSATE
jgi:hypothetical protein